ncbi:MAG: FAD-dependent oxidoreductase [Gemmatimonadota bacterium]
MAASSPPPSRRRFLKTVGGVAAGVAVGAAEGAAQDPDATFQLARSARQGQTGASRNTWDTVVVGAGVMGAWTAFELRRRGQRVLLVDASGLAHARASSGGESRATRTIYGPDDIYTVMAWESLDDWRWLSSRSGLPIFHPTGVLMLFGERDPYVVGSLESHQRLGIPLVMWGRAELARRYPQIALDGVTFGLSEPELGALMARRAVHTLVGEFVAAGGEYRLASILPPDEGGALPGLRTVQGETLEAGRYVFACGPWLPKLFPTVLAGRIFPTRQEVFYFAPPEGDDRFGPGHLPTWADFNGGDVYYGFPDLEARGFKIAHDRHGPAFDPDTGSRQITAEGLENVRGYLVRRFPDLAERPLVESRVCQYENSSNGDLLMDVHPAWPERVLLVGAGSGHGFKHGPAIGRFAADLVTGVRPGTDPRFSLATKGEVQRREVH